MAKKNFSEQSEEKSALGELISKLRNEKKLSLRKFATAVGLSPSNVTYIEKGINAPTSEIYQNIINALKPGGENQRELDRLYSIIRKVPPPDVCEILMKNPVIGEKLRLLNNPQLTNEQIQQMEKLLASFNVDTIWLGESNVLESNMW